MAKSEEVKTVRLRNAAGTTVEVREELAPKLAGYKPVTDKTSAKTDK